MFEGQKPEKKLDHLRWTTLKLAPGKFIRGWKAGRAYGIRTHFCPYSKPCKTKLTGGQLACQYCTAELRLGFTGYMPILSEEGTKNVIVYGSDIEEQVSSIPYGAPIQVRKGYSKNSPVTVAAKEWTVGKCPWLSGRKCEHDIRPWLLQLWQEPDLVAHFGLIPEQIPIMKNDDDVSPQLREQFLKGPTISELSKNRIPAKPASNGKPSTNGTH